MGKYLLTPGPVELSENVISAGAKQLIGHRTEEFSNLLSMVGEKVALLLKTQEPVVILPSSGTGALECLILNFLEKGEKFLSVSCGSFGDRFRKIGEQFGAIPVSLDVPLGESPNPDEVLNFVLKHPDCKVLLLTQNETSTGLMLPLKEIIRSIPEDKRPIILVDAVSSLGVMQCYPEDWGIDAIASASQKGLLTPPGLGVVWLSKKAWDYIENNKCPSHYFDLKMHKQRLISEQPDTPYTPPVSLFYALEEAMDMILKDGSEKWFKTRIRYSKALCVGLEALGFKLLVSDQELRSPGLTAFYSDTINADELRKTIRNMGIETAGGLNALKGKLIRVAHYNDCAWPELSLLLGSLYASLVSHGEDPDTDYIKKALNAWNEEK